MPKQNSAILLNRYIWLIDTIYSAGYISREEIDRRWCRSLLSEGEMCIPPRTFHRYKEAIQELFQITIGFSKIKGYYIENTEDIKRDGMRRWLISTFSVNNLINERVSLHNRICFEPMPSGQKFLCTILEAIREGIKLKVQHQGFSKSEPTTFTISPYCLKVFKQRWYVLAESEYQDRRLLVYCLDRFLSVEPTEEKYTIPQDFQPNDMFYNVYGVTCSNNKSELIHIKVAAPQVPFLRTLPIHCSQKEIETKEEYSIFEFFFVPTYEFEHEILSHGADWEVLTPKWLREDIKSEIDKLNNIY